MVWNHSYFTLKGPNFTSQIPVKGGACPSRAPGRFLSSLCSMLQGRLWHQWGWTKEKSPNTAGGMAYEDTAQDYRNQYDFCHGPQQAANSPARPAYTAFSFPRVPGAVSSQTRGRDGPTGTGALHRARAKPTPLHVLNGAGGKRSWVGRPACFSQTPLITVFALKLSLKTSQLLRTPAHVFLFQLLGIFLKFSFQTIKSELNESSACNMNISFF